MASGSAQDRCTGPRGHFEAVAGHELPKAASVVNLRSLVLKLWKHGIFFGKHFLRTDTLKRNHPAEPLNNLKNISNFEAHSSVTLLAVKSIFLSNIY